MLATVICFLPTEIFIGMYKTSNFWEKIVTLGLGPIQFFLVIIWIIALIQISDE